MNELPLQVQFALKRIEAEVEGLNLEQAKETIKRLAFLLERQKMLMSELIAKEWGIK